DSVQIWPSKESIGTQEELWEDIPKDIRDSEIIATDDDHHRNFDSTLFGKLFIRLCQRLNEMSLGPCNIHLDGASYHFYKQDKKPSKRKKIGELEEWYMKEKKLIEMPIGDNGKPLTKDMIYKLIKDCPDNSYYGISNIAQENGNHEIYKTPPCRSELQPIEKILTIVKNMVAARVTPKTTALEFKKWLIHDFFNIPTYVFCYVWKESINIARVYLDALNYTNQANIPGGANDDVVDIIDSPEITKEEWNRALNLACIIEDGHVGIMEPEMTNSIKSNCEEEEEEMEEEDAPLIHRRKRRHI
ncbi:hypothetical protein BGZ76_006688, partial [Entomortierella beljakovae]